MLEKSIFSTVTTSPYQTQKVAVALAKEIMKMKSGKTAKILGLVGDLGGGKTTFIQGFAGGLGIKEKITSPTFVIMKRFGNFYHIDCYRVQKSKELLTLGLKKIISNPQNIVAIEWADRVRRILPQKIIMVKLELSGRKNRKIIIVH